LEEALSVAKPEIFNSDQGSQFTAAAFTSRLESRGVAVSIAWPTSFPFSSQL
jgi:putative transposase